MTHEAGPDLAGSRRFDLGAVRVDPMGVIAWLVPAALIVYLGLKNGGYDVIPRGDAGAVVWLAILVGTLAGALPIVAVRSATGVAIILLAAFGAWTAIALAWSSSDERTMIEVARVATYLGFLVLAVGLQRRGYGRELLYGATAGIGVVVALAVLSRMESGWFPAQDIQKFIPGIDIRRRLAYPLNYSTGLAAFAAMGLPLFLSLMASGRTVLGRSLGAAAMPIAALALWWTGSGLAIPLGAIGVIAYLVLARDRLATFASLALSAVAGLVLILFAHSQSALERGATSDAMSQGDHVLIVAVVVCLAAVAGRAALDLWLRGVDREAPLLAPRRARQLLAAGAVALVAIVVLAAASGELSKRWDSFRSATGLNPNQGGQTAQVTDVSARGRYQYWQAAVKAWESKPVNGIGPGTYEFWWDQHGNAAAAIFVINAHSLYLEVLAELGVVGFLLIVSFVAVALAIGALRAWRSTLGARPGIAAATAGCFVFAAGAAVDWLWQLAVLPAAFIFLVAVAMGGEEDRAADPPAAERDDRPRGWRRFAPPAAMVALSLAALVAILIPLASATAVDQSRQDVADGNLTSALDSARDAVAIEPFASTPRLQEATTLELMGRLPEAVAAARAATDRESSDWRPWVVLSRLEAENGNPGAAVAAYRHAYSLFPRGLAGPS